MNRRGNPAAPAFRFVCRPSMIDGRVGRANEYFICILLIVLLIGLGAYIAGRTRAIATARGKLSTLHSLPGYHGTYVAIWATLPALFVLVLWLLSAPLYVENSIRSSLPEDVRTQGGATVELALGQIKSVAAGLKLLDETEIAALSNGSANLRETLAAKGVPLAGDGGAYMVKAAQDYNSMTSTSRLAMAGVVILLRRRGAGGHYEEEACNAAAVRRSNRPVAKPVRTHQRQAKRGP